MNRWDTRSVLVATLLMCLITSCGCSSLRLPAIDPTGERIFLPPPSSTTLVGPDCDLPCWPEPAFTSPPDPPPCPPSALAAPPTLAPMPAATMGLALPAKQSRLMLAPLRVVAPVGGEVVLLAGVCGDKGFYTSHQPIEWTSEGVGHFVEVGDGGSWFCNALLCQRPRKVNAQYALGRTGSRPQLITRGTPTPADDITLPKGQCWISVTSASEGTSRVTAMAPLESSWELRRQTATIHWIDAQWTLPGPAILRAGQSHTLTTTLTRSAGSPITGWLVRYEMIGDPVAAFAPAAAASVDVPTDANGQASAQISPVAGHSGAGHVRIQIIRPATDDAPAIVVGQGSTSVTWSAPGLALQAIASESASVDSPVAVQVNVSNPGDMTTHNVVVSAVIPPGMKLINSLPTGQLFGDRIQWNLGDLAAGTTQTITINLRAELDNSVRILLSARSDDQLTAEASADVRIFRPALSLSVSGPQSAAVGETIRFRIEATNTGTRPLRNVVLIDRFDPGLELTSGELSPVENPLGDLEAGQTLRRGLTFIARRAGQLCHTVSVEAEGGHADSYRACVEVSQPAEPSPAAAPARLRVSISGPDQSRVGDLVLYTIEVRNEDSAPAANLRITAEFPDSLQPTRASAESQPIVGGRVWKVELLPPGELRRFQVECSCLRTTPAAVTRTTVTAEEGIELSDEARTEIVAAAPAVPTEDTPMPPVEVPGSGELTVSVTDRNDPIRVGGRTIYRIVVKNERNVSDRNLVVTVLIPEGMRFEKFSRTRRPDDPVGVAPAEPKIAPDGRTIEIVNIKEVRAGETLPAYEVEVSAQQTGKFTLGVEATSFRSRGTITASAETTVIE